MGGVRGLARWRRVLSVPRVVRRDPPVLPAAGSPPLPSRPGVHSAPCTVGSASTTRRRPCGAEQRGLRPGAPCRPSAHPGGSLWSLCCSHARAPFPNSHRDAAQPGSSRKEAPRGGQTQGADWDSWLSGDNQSGRVVMLSWPLCRSEGQGRPARSGSGLSAVLRGFVQPDGVVWSPGGSSEASRILKAAFISPHVPSLAGSTRGTQGRLGVAVGPSFGQSCALQWET